MTSAARINALAIGVLLLLAAMLGLFATLSVAASRAEDANARAVLYVRDMLVETSAIESAVNATVRGERGFLLTGDATFLDPYHLGRQRLAQSLDKLERLARRDNVQEQRVAALREKVDAYLAIVTSIVADEQAGRHDRAVQRVRAYEGRAAIRGITTEIDRIKARAQQALATRSAEAEQSAKLAQRLEYLLGAVAILLLALGAGATLALRRALLREEAIKAELRLLATRDELTGLANRHELFASLDRMVAAARRQGRPLSVALLDIDRFKLVNDTHGHPAGDEVIRRVAQMTLAMMREQDLVGRLGGEEFLVALPDTPAQDAAAACERLREGIAALPILLPEGRAIGVSISIGVTALDPDDDRTRLIGRADEALYQAKKGGRDQVRLAA